MFPSVFTVPMTWFIFMTLLQVQTNHTPIRRDGRMTNPSESKFRIHPLKINMEAAKYTHLPNHHFQLLLGYIIWNNIFISKINIGPFIFRGIFFQCAVDSTVS